MERKRFILAYDPQKHNRRSIRLEGYDYSSPGLYFVTMSYSQPGMPVRGGLRGQHDIERMGQAFRHTLPGSDGRGASRCFRRRAMKGEERRKGDKVGVIAYQPISYLRPVAPRPDARYAPRKFFCKQYLRNQSIYIVTII
ncbi:MAG: hypothetical protein U5K69_27120 [Balneolaceae bacterium]|nr:hypothetical protein [Balneolaceae bacterium]